MSKKKTTKNTGTQRKKSHSPKGLRTARAWKYIQQVQRWVRTHPELDVLQREARDTDSDRAKRRIEATVNTYDDMLQLLRHAKIEIPNWIETDWLDRNTTGIYGPDYIDHTYSTTLAVAIYILDQLLASGRYQEACSLIPPEALKADVHIPEIKDVSNVFACMPSGIHMLHEPLNGECSPKCSRNSWDTPVSKQPWIDMSM